MTGAFEDMTHLAVLDGLAREIQQNLIEFNARSNGKTDKAELLKIRLEQNDILKELLRKQRRALAFMAGEKIEPETHFGEAIIRGEGGMGPNGGQQP